ncbi:MgtC/SapB family protein [Sagittula stellata]|uniref:Protein MgtC n=1 Tax=Sagittula stellata (strain ATCC 700073 / DSM 11524 / E-37) TaxID=388399 RepID=A3JZR5_SAGS3|nr:MgtC/SapB family protein [Sagittula stellata]EBA09968.1 hypothetical protein SSE37_09168 [Sagittula stellata E-37]
MFEQVAGELGACFSVVPASLAFTRLLVAVVLSAIVGLERELQGKPAGLRTHILVAVAACLFVLVGQELSSIEFGNTGEQRHDPLRMIEAVTAGVAFLAAGVIFTSGGKVQNLTTGASLWLCGAIGLGCGAGSIALASMATGIVVVVLFVLGQVEKVLGTQTDA